MRISDIREKIKLRLRAEIVKYLRYKSCYVKIYCSYWHYRFYDSINQENCHNYYTAVPNRGAGIGHQLANWIAGYWFARQFGLHFAHTPFLNPKWEQFIGFGEDETSVEVLLHEGYKKVRLPLFNELNSEEVELNKKIINSYCHQRVVFVAEQDQFYRDQFGVIDDLKRKFYAATARKNDKLSFSKDQFNIAIHVRRGDIVVDQGNQNPNLVLRWQDALYFENVLTTVIENIRPNKPISIYLFSQGQRKDFPEFEKFNNLFFCLDMGAQDSFLHMVYADLLIASKSSFSYKPALLSNGIKILPRDFWHGYPDASDWIFANEDGSFDVNQIKVNIHL